MTQPSDDESSRYARLLAENLREVTQDLRTIDLGDLVAFLRFGSYATIEDLVLSSTELFFRSGTLNFAWAGDVDVPWGAEPCVTMAMEFHHRAVSVFFDLSLRAVDDTVTIGGVLFEDGTEDAGDRLDRLARAIAEARLPQPARAGSRQRL